MDWSLGRLLLLMMMAHANYTHTRRSSPTQSPNKAHHLPTYLPAAAAGSAAAARSTARPTSGTGIGRGTPPAPRHAGRRSWGGGGGAGAGASGQAGRRGCGRCGRCRVAFWLWVVGGLDLEIGSRVGSVKSVDRLSRLRSLLPPPFITPTRTRTTPTLTCSIQVHASLAEDRLWRGTPSTPHAPPFCFSLFYVSIPIDRSMHRPHSTDSWTFLLTRTPQTSDRQASSKRRAAAAAA